MSKEIGRKIKLIRQSKHISQKELAKNSNIAQSTLSYIERGKKNPQFDTLSAICKGLDITIFDLLIYEESKINAKMFKEHAAIHKPLEKAPAFSFVSLLP